MATTTKQQRRQLQDEGGVPGQGAAFTREERPGAGSMLRHAREELGWDIYQVGDALKIRPEYLDALERNSLDGLPGPAYATGFLKTYADFLHLDTNEVVRRFKAEKSALSRKPELTFPVPLTDRGIPGGGLFLTALILIALGYGTWYYMSSGRHSTPMAVEAVPNLLLNPPPATPPDQKTAATGTLASPNPVISGTPAAPDASNPASPPSSAAIVAKAPSGTPATSSNTSGGDNGAATLGAPVPPNPSPAAPASPADNPNAAADQTASADSPHVYGQNTAGHLVVHATAESWVQIKDNGNPIFTRVLKPGDTYNVPDRPGLVLRTGNAGGIQISADGKDMAALGAPGQVKGNVALDPEKLASAPAE